MKVSTLALKGELSIDISGSHTVLLAGLSEVRKVFLLILHGIEAGLS